MNYIANSFIKWRKTDITDAKTNYNSKRDSSRAERSYFKQDVLPETTRASFGPTVWQFPIVSAVKSTRYDESFEEDAKE